MIKTRKEHLRNDTQFLEKKFLLYLYERLRIDLPYMGDLENVFRYIALCFHVSNVFF